MMRLLRLLYPIVLLAGLLLVSASPASAAFGVDDCKSAPVAEAPGGGISGFFGDTGATASGGSGWANGAPKFDHYGMAGLSFHNYDLGCGPDATRDPGAVVGTTIANWMLEGAKFGVAATGALLHAAYHPTYLQVFDPLLTNATRTLRSSIFVQWVPLTIAAVGVMLIWRSRRAQWSHTVATVAWALLVMVIAAAVFSYPVKAGSFADATVGQALGAVNDGINGQGRTADPSASATGSLSNAVLYEQWKMGTFGRGNSATADKYGKAIYTGQALTYAEAKIVRDDPDGEGKALLDRKAKQWQDAADQISEQDPDAYQYLTGHKGEGRVAAAIVAAVATLCVIPFLLASSLLLIGAFLIIRLAVVFFPVIATVGIAYQFRGAVKGIGTVVAAAVLNSIMFGIGTAVTILAVRILLSPQSAIPLWLALALMGVFSFIMWVALKPMRKLTAMASPSHMFGDAAGAVGNAASNVKDSAVGIGKQAIAAYAGTSIALDQHDDEDDGQKAPPVARSEGYSTPTPEPAPAPAPASAPAPAPAALTGAADRAGLVGADVPAGPSPLPPGAPVAEPQPALTGAPALPASPPTEDEAQGRVVLDASSALLSDTPETTLADNPVFIPGSAPEDLHVESLPPAAEPEIDPSTGDEVYTLFRPEDVEAER